jgi:hypothetical protein
MAYTTPATWSTGQIVVASQLNEQIRDNMTYVHDALSTGSQTLCFTPSTGSITRTHSTIYQNTTSKIRFVCVVTSPSSGGQWNAISDTATSPTIVVASNGIESGYSPMTFIVLPSYYYELVCVPGGATGGLARWVEWDIH